MASQPPRLGVGGETLIGLVGVVVSAMLGYLAARKQMWGQIIAEKLRLESSFRDQLMSRINTLDNRVQTLEGDRDKNIARISELETEKVKLLDDIEHLQHRVEELEADNARLKEQVNCSLLECPFKDKKGKEGK